MFPFSKKFFTVFLFLPFNALSQKPGVVFENVLLQKDVVVEGAKGFKISGKCNFLSYKQNYTTDSLMNRAFLEQAFYLSITPTQKDTGSITPAMGYSVAFPNEKVTTKIKMKPNQTAVKSGKMEFSWFLPYAALKIDAGNQEVFFALNFYGKDGLNNVVSGKHKTEKMAIVKPKTRVFEIQLDSIVVKAYDTNNQLWDVNISGTDKPDLDWSINVGDLKVNSVHKGNSLEINFGDKPRSFKFMISENDEVYINLVDTDEFVDDPIANWKYNSTNMKSDVVYKQEEKKANLAAFGFSSKIGPVK